MHLIWVYWIVGLEKKKEKNINITKVNFKTQVIKLTFVGKSGWFFLHHGVWDCFIVLD